MKKILITGGAGFIGSHLIDKLLQSGDFSVICIDNFDPFYDVSIKRSNISQHIGNPLFKLIELDIRNYNNIEEKLSDNYDIIVHLAAKAGVNPSVKDPISYQIVNVIGTQNILEFCRKKNIKQFVFASSSSVYGINASVPWSENDKQLQPISPYASSKISAELLGHTYSHLFGIRFISLRFFTVFGPRQRPDLAIHKFSKMILNNEEITLYGDGSTGRDYTYVDDVVNGIVAAMTYNASMYEIFNLGNHRIVKLSELIEHLERTFEKKAKLKYLEEQQGDVPVTYASICKATEKLNYKPSTTLAEGLLKFREWLLNQNK